MGPVNQVAGCQQKLDFFLTTSLVVVGEKLSTNPRIGQSSCCRLRREPFFSGAMDLFKFVDNYAKGCYAWTT
jgi:hypothetical protein